ncbi:MAG: AMP-binding protein [Pseudomonadota bacterium]
MFPISNHGGLDAPFASHQGVPISRRRFLQDVQRFASTLPAQGTPINLCVDRYAFAVSWVAAMQRGQTSLMPPNPLPETLRRLQATHPLVYGVCDAQGLGQWESVSDFLPLHRCEAPAAGDLRSETAVDALDPALVSVCLLTSGSTDVPQPHVRSWGMLAEGGQVAAQRIAAEMGQANVEGLHLLATVPPQHSYGLESSVLLSLVAGAVLVSERPFFPADIVEGLQRLPRPRALVTTPLHLKNLLRSDLALPPVDLVLCATAPLSLALTQEAERLLGPLIEIYGCTEAGQIAMRRTLHGQRWATLGGLQIVRHADAETDASTFEVHGGHLPQARALTDALRLVDERHFYLLGRANDLINVAGKRHSLSHLNMQLNRIDGVDDGCFWLPEERADAVVRTVAFVVAPSLTADDILACLRQRIESAFLPRRVVHVAALPREATGKLTASALREFALKTLQDCP